MDNKPQVQEGDVQQPTPEPEMSPKVQPTEPANPPKEEAKANPVIETLRAAGIPVDENATSEQITDKLRNLQSFVGDQTVAKQRQISETLSKQTGLSLDELQSVLETEQGLPPETAQVVTPERISQVKADSTVDEIRQLKLENFVAKMPQAAPIQDKLLARARELKTTNVAKIWQEEYEPVLKAGMQLGSEKLRSTVEQQPISGASTASETVERLDPASFPNTMDGVEKLRSILPKAQQQ
jgi:Xaa-Pro aminopeptidase